MIIVKEYFVVSESENQIVVGVPFQEMGGTSPPTFKHKGKIYKRGMIVVVPRNLLGKVCTCREYNL